MVLHEAILTPKIKEKIVALVVFGDPFTADTGLASQLTGGLTGDLSDGQLSSSETDKTFPPADSDLTVWPVNNPGENTKSFCHPEDPICGGGNDEKAHGTCEPFSCHNPLLVSQQSVHKTTTMAPPRRELSSLQGVTLHDQEHN